MTCQAISVPYLANFPGALYWILMWFSSHSDGQCEEFGVILVRSQSRWSSVWIRKYPNGVFTAPDTTRDMETETDIDNFAQNPMWISVDVCLCVVWTPPHNSNKPFFNLSLYRSRCRAVWTHHKFCPFFIHRQIITLYFHPLYFHIPLMLFFCIVLE